MSLIGSGYYIGTGWSGQHIMKKMEVNLNILDTSMEHWIYRKTSITPQNWRLWMPSSLNNENSECISEVVLAKVLYLASVPHSAIVASFYSSKK